MLQIKGQKWNTTQHNTLVKSVKKWFQVHWNDDSDGDDDDDDDR